MGTHQSSIHKQMIEKKDIFFYTNLVLFFLIFSNILEAVVVHLVQILFHSVKSRTLFRKNGRMNCDFAGFSFDSLLSTVEKIACFFPICFAFLFTDALHISLSVSRWWYQAQFAAVSHILGNFCIFTCFIRVGTYSFCV